MMSEAPPPPSTPSPIPRDGSERSDERFNAFKEYLLVHTPINVNAGDSGKSLARGHETNHVNIRPSTMNQPPGQAPAASAAASGDSIRRRHSETSTNETSRRASSGRRRNKSQVVSTEYSIRDVASGRGGNDRNESQGLRMPSLRQSASERIQLRQMLLGESVGGNDNDGTSNIDMRGSGHTWQYQPVSASRKSLRGSGHSSFHSLRSSDAGENYHSSKSLSFSGSMAGQSAQTANEEWPEFASNSIPHREIGARFGKLSRNDEFDAAKGRRETIRTLYSNGESSEHDGSNDDLNCRETVRTSNNVRGLRRDANHGKHEQGIRSEAQMKDDDLQFNNDVRRRSVGRRVSLPNLGGSPGSNQQHTELGKSTNSAGSASMMAEYIALKIKVAELQSELQVAHSQAQKYTSGLKQAQETMEKLRDDNVKLSRRNAELAEENASLVTLLGPGERDRFVKQKSKGGGLATIDGGKKNGKMMIPTKTEGRRQTSSNAKRSNSWKKPELDWGSINDSDRTGSKMLQSLREGGEKSTAHQGGEDSTRPKRRHSWWVKRSATMPEDQMLVQDFPPRRSSEPPDGGDDDASTASQRQRRGWGPWTRRQSDEAACGSGDQINSRSSFVESMMNLPRSLSKPQLASEEGRDPQKEDKEGKKDPQQQKKEVVPEYIQFNEDDEANLRCSDLSFDVVLSASFTKLAQEALERSGLEQLRMSDIDEQGSKYNDAPAAVPTSPGENGERGHAKSGTTSDAESLSLWRSSGPLAYSMTTEQDGGNATPNNEQQPQPKGEETDESLRVEESDDDNLSFAFSSVGGATPADEPVGESATQAEI